MSKTALLRHLTVGAVLAISATTALAAAPAFAAEPVGVAVVKVTSITTSTVTSTTVEFTAGINAVNKLEVFGTMDPVLSIKDLNKNPIKIDRSAASRCSYPDPLKLYAIRCKDTAPFDAIFNLGDRDDSYLNANGHVPTTVRGGIGNDILDATLAMDPVKLYGEGGNDRLIGGIGDDILNTGPAAGIGLQTANGGKGTDACTGAQTVTSNCEPVIQN